MSKGGLLFTVAVQVSVTLILFDLLVAMSQRTCIASVSFVSHHCSALPPDVILHVVSAVVSPITTPIGAHAG
jgi:hypothetical protein